MAWTPERRTFIRLGLASSAVGIAGCSGGGSEETEEEDDEEEDDESTATAAATEATTAPQSTETAPQPTEEPDPQTVQSTESQRTPYADPEGAIDSWLQNTSNYNGTIQDRRGEDRVSVQVGADGNGGAFAYSPPAVRVQSGNTVFWQWRGRGGAHNVSARNGEFRSGDPVEGGGLSFQVTFEETGLFLYECDTHSNFGMRGAVLVEEPQTLSGYPRVDDWLSDYDYSGRLSDQRGQSALEITVGADTEDGAFGFRPIAPLVDPGTEINFNWTGRGGNHSIDWEETPTDVANSESTSSAQGSYSITLDTPGVYLYGCGDHRIFGGHGAIVVNDA